MTGHEQRTARVLVTLGLLAWAGVACARPGSPGGGPPDRRPPVVIETSPAPGALVEDLTASIRLRFSERISERVAGTTLDNAILVSPRTGAVRVSHKSDALEVSIEGGFRPDLIYRVTVLPVIADLFGNRMTEPFELAFSTGAEMVENALAGQILDRITGEPMPEATVALLPLAPVPDTLLHVARSDRDGLFYLRYVPLGRYSLVAFQDRNLNFVLDPAEPRGDRGVLVGAGDTLIVDVAVLGPDTTPAQLLRVEITDSSLLRLVFTDYLDPEAAERAAVSLENLDGGSAPAVTRVLHPDAWDELRDSLAAVADS